MESLDLHGLTYGEAEIEVENFILSVTLPAEIITGNSQQMRKIAKSMVNKHGMGLFQSNPTNFGSFVVLEKKIW
jgi:DNA-nicking Smr family endonuclease